MKGDVEEVHVLSVHSEANEIILRFKVMLRESVTFRLVQIHELVLYRITYALISIRHWQILRDVIHPGKLLVYKEIINLSISLASSTIRTSFDAYGDILGCSPWETLQCQVFRIVETHIGKVMVVNHALNRVGFWRIQPFKVFFSAGM